MPVDSKAGFATMRSEDFKQGGAGMKQHYVMPVGEDDFKRVREQYYYVDKTDLVKTLIDGHAAFWDGRHSCRERGLENNEGRLSYAL